MKILSLERIIGPGKSVDENFEILCLELIKLPASDPLSIYRNLPPDGGIDIYNARPNSPIAFQCKAYPQFRSDLVKAVEDSARKAQETSTDRPFDAYVLMIPFVPTHDQRMKLENALKKSGSQSFIMDGDELERRLFDAPQVAKRFFPSVTIIMPPNCETLELLTGLGEPLSLYIESIRTGQKIPFRASSGATIHGVVNYLVTLLRLPELFDVNAASFHNKGNLEWELAIKRKGIEVRLPSDKTLEEAGIQNDDVVYLVFEVDVKFRMGYAKPIGIHWEKISIDSYIWDINAMNSSLLKDEWEGHSDRDRFKELVDNYYQWHFMRVRNSMSIDTK